MAQIVIVGAGLGGLSFAYHYTGTAKLVLIEVLFENTLTPLHYT